MGCEDCVLDGGTVGEMEGPWVGWGEAEWDVGTQMGCGDCGLDGGTVGGTGRPWMEWGDRGWDGGTQMGWRDPEGMCEWWVGTEGPCMS